MNFFIKILKNQKSIKKNYLNYHKINNKENLILNKIYILLKINTNKIMNEKSSIIKPMPLLITQFKDPKKIQNNCKT